MSPLRKRMRLCFGAEVSTIRIVIPWRHFACADGVDDRQLFVSPLIELVDKFASFFLNLFLDDFRFFFNDLLDAFLCT